MIFTKNLLGRCLPCQDTMKLFITHFWMIGPAPISGLQKLVAKLAFEFRWPEGWDFFLFQLFITFKKNSLWLWPISWPARITVVKEETKKNDKESSENYNWDPGLNRKVGYLYISLCKDPITDIVMHIIAYYQSL